MGTPSQNSFVLATNAQMMQLNATPKHKTWDEGTLRPQESCGAGHLQYGNGAYPPPRIQGTYTLPGGGWSLHDKDGYMVESNVPLGAEMGRGTINYLEEGNEVGPYPPPWIQDKKADANDWRPQEPHGAGHLQYGNGDYPPSMIQGACPLPGMYGYVHMVGSQDRRMVLQGGANKMQGREDQFSNFPHLEEGNGFDY